MTLYVQDADLAIHHGDALEVLRGLPDGCVNCCVTSPPYWGLRDYGTGAWDGGDPKCDHVGRTAGGPPGSAKQESNHGANGVLLACRCGARRVDAQLGLEATPEAYVAALVAVLREVRRVLADDGTLWLNLGSSYLGNDSGGMTGSTLAKGGKQTSSSRAGRAARRDAASRDTAYTAPQDSPASGSACLDLCDGCADDLSRRNPRSIQPHPVSASPDSPTDPRNATQDQSEPPLPHGAPASTTPESSPPLPVFCWRCGTRQASVSLRVLPTSSPDAQASVGTEAYTNGTSPLESDARNQSTDAEGMAWVNYTRRLKQKDMVPTPWMVAMALQMDGWYLRSDIIWGKSNPMPESVTDRPTKAHEYVFLLSKGPRYWFDQEAVREPVREPERESDPYPVERFKNGRGSIGVPGGYLKSPSGGRNVRSVWEIATQPYAEAHFATFPEELVRRCILAGCPEWVCGTCGKPRERIVERPDSGGLSAPGFSKFEGQRNDNNRRGPGTTMSNNPRKRLESSPSTTGWSDCGHSKRYAEDDREGDYRPGVVLDPFGGSGTTALVARKHGRKAILIELSAAYCKLAAERCQQLSLLAEQGAA